MTTPMSDSTLAIVKAEAECGFIAGIEGETVLRVIERLAKAEAERDAAVAAIVAWLRVGDADLIAETTQRSMDTLADAIERGDHLTEAKEG